MSQAARRMLSRTAANGTCAPRTSAEPPRTSRSVLRIQLSVLESSQSEQRKPPKRQEDPQPIGSLSFLSPFVFCPREHKPCRVSLVFALFPHSRCIRLCNFDDSDEASQATPSHASLSSSFSPPSVGNSDVHPPRRQRTRRRPNNPKSHRKRHQ